MGITFVKAPAGSTLLAVSAQQAARLFQELRVVKAEIVEGVSAWTFAGGLVLILDHTSEPASFRLALDTPDG